MKKYLRSFSVLTILFLLTGCAGSAASKSNQATGDLSGQVQQLTAEKSELAAALVKATEETSQAQTESSGMKTALQKLESEKTDIQSELDKANERIRQFAVLEEKYKGLSEAEADAQTAANERKAEEDRKAREAILEQERKAEEAKAAEEAKQAEAEAKKGYDSGITFTQLARTPDDYKDKKVKFTGKVIQMIQGDGEIQLRVAVNSDYDKVILVYYPENLLEKRVLEDDKITLYGVSKGLYTYKSTLGGEITVPLVEVDKIEIK